MHITRKHLLSKSIIWRNNVHHPIIMSHGCHIGYNTIRYNLMRNRIDTRGRKASTIPSAPSCTFLVIRLLGHAACTARYVIYLSHMIYALQWGDRSTKQAADLQHASTIIYAVVPSSTQRSHKSSNTCFASSGPNR